MSQDNPEDSDLAAGALARVSAMLCDAGLVLCAWAALWSFASLFDPGSRGSLDAFFLRCAAPWYLPAVSLLLAESPGQRLVGLRVLDSKYYPLSRARLVLRSLVFEATLPLCVLNLPLAAFTREGRVLHDLATRTKVMRDPAASRLRAPAAALLGLAAAAALGAGLNLMVRDRIALAAVLPRATQARADALAPLRALAIEEEAVADAKK